VAQISAVRFTLRDYQLSMRKYPGLIAEGRDQGFIFDTPYRFFLKTSAEERARRRVLQFQSLGLPADYNSILKAILERDESDRYNPAHPLVPHDEAMVIHTDRLTIKQVARIIVAACTDVKFLKRNKNPLI
jgi:cytidylate kinase